MAQKIRIRIKDQDLLGVKRAVILESVNFLDYKLEEGQFIWREKYITNTDVDIEHKSIATRRIVTSISNTVKVTDIGIPITIDLIKSIRPIKPDETHEIYEEKISKRLEEALAIGIPQFDYWVDKLINRESGISFAEIENNLNKFE